MGYKIFLELSSSIMATESLNPNEHDEPNPCNTSSFIFFSPFNYAICNSMLYLYITYKNIYI